MSKEAKPVDMIATDYVRIAVDGEPEAVIVSPGTVMPRTDPELAMILAGSGKARPVTKEELAAARKAASEETLKPKA